MSGELLGVPVIDGHSLSREQIAKHGKDRYPTAELNALKLCAEAGELADALLKHHHGAYGGRCTSPCQHAIHAEIRHELADTGLALYALCNKLGLNLTEVMAELVDGDRRDFR